MAYSATYAISDFAPILFDLIGGVIAYFAGETSSIGSLLFLGFMFALLGWIATSIRGVGKKTKGMIPGL